MADRMNPQQQRKCMQSIRSKNTKPELLVRRFLFSRGLRYRLNVKKLPGSPDIVLKNTVQPFSSTDASGMDIRTASILYCLRQILYFGKKK